MFRVHCRHMTTLELHDFYLLWHMETGKPKGQSHFCPLQDNKVRNTEIDKPRDNHLFARYRKTSLGNASRAVDVISLMTP